MMWRDIKESSRIRYPTESLHPLLDGIQQFNSYTTLTRLSCVFVTIKDCVLYFFFQPFFELLNCRHPCISQKALNGGDFIPNDIVLGKQVCNDIILTVPKLWQKTFKEINK